MRKLEFLQKALNGCEDITILGHDNIDVDAFLSGILLSNLLNFLNIDNQFIVIEEIKEDITYKIIEETCGIDMKLYCKKNEDCARNFILVDHYETKHRGTTIACIDHHPTILKNQHYKFYYTRKACSTSYIIYEMMLECNYPISREEAKMILVSMMVDTVSFRSGKTIPEEVIDAKKLAKTYELDYNSIEKYCLCLTPIKEMTVDEIINNGYKYYNYFGNKVKSSYLQLKTMPKKKEFSEWTFNIKSELKKEDLDMWVFIIFDCKRNITFEYQITDDGVKITRSNGILSRGTDIMPKIEKLFQNKRF